MGGMPPLWSAATVATELGLPIEVPQPAQKAAPAGTAFPQLGQNMEQRRRDRAHSHASESYIRKECEIVLGVTHLRHGHGLTVMVTVPELPEADWAVNCTLVDPSNNRIET